MLNISQNLHTQGRAMHTTLNQNAICSYGISANNGRIWMHCCMTASIRFSAACIAAQFLHVGRMVRFQGRCALKKYLPIQLFGINYSWGPLPLSAARGRHVKSVAARSLQNRMARTSECALGSCASSMAAARYPLLHGHADSRRTKRALAASEGEF